MRKSANRKGPVRSYQRKSGVVRFQVPKEPEVCLGKGTLRVDIDQRDDRTCAMPNTVWTFAKGDSVSIAKARITGAGPSYRIMNTIIWLGPDQLEASPDLIKVALNTIDNNELARKWANSITSGKPLTSEEKRVKVYRDETVKSVNRKIPIQARSQEKTKGKTKESKSTSRSLRIAASNNNVSLKGRKSYMDKKELRTLICGLTPSTRLHVTFLGGKAHLTGDYTVTKIRTGRGRGGSKIVDLVDAFKNVVATGTKDNESILNITVNGTMHGHKVAEEVPTNYPKDLSHGEKLRSQFEKLLEAEGDFTVKIESPMPSMNGIWTVNKAAKGNGRVRQIKLSLENTEDGRKIEAWSYRHSGAIKSFTILDAEGNVPEVTSCEEDEQDEDPNQFADGPEDSED